MTLKRPWRCLYSRGQMKNKALFFSTIIVVVFFISLLTRNGDIALLNIIFIAYLFRSVASSRVKEDIQLTAQRSAQKSISDKGLSIDVTIAVTNDGAQTVCLFLEDPQQKGTKITKGSLKQCIALRANSKHEWTYSFSSQRGFYQWDTLSVKVSDPAACLQTEIAIPAPSSIAVPPQYRKLRPFDITPWETLTAPGTVPTRRSGNSTDFYGVREYHPGDPLRLIDWKKTARQPNQYFTKEFQQERTADIAIVVDGRKNRNLEIGENSIFESMIETAAGLCQMFLHQGQRVGFYVAGENSRVVLPAYGKKQLYRILDCMAAAETGDDGSGDALYTLPTKQLSSKTQLFFISPVDRDDVMYLRSLRSRGLQIFLIRPDTYSFAFSKGRPADSSSIGFRLGKLEDQCVKLMLLKMSITVIDWKIGDPVQSPLMRALNTRRAIKQE